MKGKKTVGNKSWLWSGLKMLLLVACLTVTLVHMTPGCAAAAPFQIPDINFSINNNTEGPAATSEALQILALLTVLAIAPTFLILMTSFTRIIVVLSFLRSALATQQMPPTQILLGLALFLTFFVMAPTWREVNKDALQPYLAGQIKQEVAFEKAMAPMRTFMFRQTREKDLALFVELSGSKQPATYKDIPNYVVIPAFAISELKTAFQIGFVIFVPFLVIDMVVSSALMSMGMMMLPPMMISLPFKILLFVLVDGWNLIIYSLVKSFQG